MNRDGTPCPNGPVARVAPSDLGLLIGADIANRRNTWDHSNVAGLGWGQRGDTRGQGRLACDVGVRWGLDDGVTVVYFGNVRLLLIRLFARIMKEMGPPSEEDVPGGGREAAVRCHTA
jgi:hypothetical protein